MPVDFTNIPSPCFVLDEKLLIKNLELMQKVQSESSAKIILALKGFSMYKMFPLVKQYLAGATASSLNEARLIFEEMKCKAHTYCPALNPSEFNELMTYSSHITFNSVSQYEQYKMLVKTYAPSISMGLRINPQYAEIETDMYNPCVVGSRLGVTRQTLGEHLPEGIEGLHSHTLCENDSYVLERTLLHIEDKFGDFLSQIKWLNLGGGHLMTKVGYDLKHLVNLIKLLKSKYKIEIILEPGSAVAWQTGYLKSTVLDIVDGQGIKIAILDTSFAAHMPDTLEMPYRPKVWGAFDGLKGEYVYRLGGMTCLAGDYLNEYSFDNPLNIGDTVIFDDMIHYTMVKTNTFNGVALPSIGVWDTNDTFQIHKQFGYEVFKEKL